jgi:hypothetical protein
VPPARSAAWLACCAELHRHLAASGTVRLRTPGTVWRAAQLSPPPPRFTWGALCGAVTWSDFLCQIGQPCTDARTPVSSWNVRWLVNPHSHAAAAKRAVLVRLLTLGHVVCVQETHWLPPAVAQWQALFPYATVAATAARPGPNRGWQGGVAWLLPLRGPARPRRGMFPARLGQDCGWASPYPARGLPAPDRPCRHSAAYDGAPPRRDGRMFLGRGLQFRSLPPTGRR